jgi:two-component system LytT family response regulator
VGVTPPASADALRVLVVDDEPTARQRVVRLLREIPGVLVVGECGSGREAVRAARARRPDLVFLDVAMPGVDGLSVARYLAAPDGPLVVFVTAYGEHALEAFRVHAADYVLKPIDRARLRDAVEHARLAVRRARLAADPGARPAAAGARVALRDGHRTHLVPSADILWIESFGNYARVYTPVARYIHRATMAALTAELAPLGFARIHRTVIVNAARVVRLGPAGGGHEALLDTGHRLRVSRTFRGALNGVCGG